MTDGPMIMAYPVAIFGTSALFKVSQQVHEPGWTTQDLVADPKFVKYADVREISDLRLTPGSPAIDAGQPLPEHWPDPLRTADAGLPDIGAIPLGTADWGVGVDGRIPLFGGPTVK